ncbi:MAG: hypothetical protein MJ159_00320 [Treponemataceae bacterium]|nr:hypothetical protein [Treponemataceae bacterium]
MEIKELENKVETLTKKKQGYDRNRSICALVIAIIGYYIYQAYKTDNPQWWFYAIMAAIILISAAILVFDCLQIKKISQELKPFEDELKALLNEEQNENAAQAETDETEKNDEDSDEPTFSAGSFYD